ncbi:hypothetical protein DFH09DRAFT_914602, partial [Mycena vulgaris]
YLVPILALFAGRVEDLPERDMPETELASGGSVAHQVFIVGKILFFVIELATPAQPIENSVAQLFAALFSASKMNRNRAAGFEALTVYGLLTDMGAFHFYAFDPTSETFYRDRKVVVGRVRGDFLYDMMAVADKIFSLVLQGYVDTLKAAVPRRPTLWYWYLLYRSARRLGVLMNPGQPTRRCASRGAWERALEYALAAQTKLAEFSISISSDAAAAEEGLRLLACSVGFVGRTTEMTGARDVPGESELEGMAAEAVARRWAEGRG